jgi:hypothetical protein
VEGVEGEDEEGDESVDEPDGEAGADNVIGGGHGGRLTAEAWRARRKSKAKNEVNDHDGEWMLCVFAAPMSMREREERQTSNIEHRTSNNQRGASAGRMCLMR